MRLKLSQMSHFIVNEVVSTHPYVLAGKIIMNATVLFVLTNDTEIRIGKMISKDEDVKKTVKNNLCCHKIVLSKTVLKLPVLSSIFIVIKILAEGM